MLRIIRCFSTGRSNYYDILGVPKAATQKEIKKAFIQLSKKYHPDITGSNEAATKKFVQIKEAYDTLKDEGRRRDYDSMLRGGFGFGGYNQSQGFGGSPFGRQPFNEEMFKQWKSGPGNFHFYYKKGNVKFTDEDFQRIWREFQKATQNPRNKHYDEQMFREARQKIWDEFSKKREERWKRQATEHFRKYPFDNMRANPIFNVNWERFNKILLVYIGAFFIVAFFQAIYSSSEGKYKKPLNGSPPPPQTPTSQYAASESLRDLMNKPPVPPSQYNQPSQDIYEDKSFGFPKF